MTLWPYDDAMTPAGALGEWELDAACWRMRQIVLTPDQCAAVDETAGLCGVCGGECPTPQACERPHQDPHTGHRRVIAYALMTAGAIVATLCITAYLRSPT